MHLILYPHLTMGKSHTRAQVHHSSYFLIDRVALCVRASHYGVAIKVARDVFAALSVTNSFEPYLTNGVDCF